MEKGDIVKIKPLKELIPFQDMAPGFVPAMHQYCGKQAVLIRLVDDANEKNVWRCDNGWLWLEDWFENPNLIENLIDIDFDDI